MRRSAARAMGNSVDAATPEAPLPLRERATPQSPSPLAGEGSTPKPLSPCGRGVGERGADPTVCGVRITANLKAALITRFKDITDDGGVIELVVWRVPQPVPPTSHGYKYRAVRRCPYRHARAAGACRSLIRPAARPNRHTATAARRGRHRKAGGRLERGGRAAQHRARFGLHLALTEILSRPGHDSRKIQLVLRSQAQCPDDAHASAAALLATDLLAGAEIRHSESVRAELVEALWDDLGARALRQAQGER